MGITGYIFETNFVKNNVISSGTPLRVSINLSHIWAEREKKDLTIQLKYIFANQFLHITQG